MHSISRRNFLQAATAGTIAALATKGRAAAAVPKPGPVCLFTKPIDTLPPEEICGMAAEAGFKALDLTVRKNGRIQPATVEKDLPAFAETARQAGLAIPLMVTALTGAGDADAQRVLKTAAAAGIRAYRMGYIQYEDGKPPREQLPAIHERFVRLAALNAEVGLCGLYQNHAGRALGAAVWDLAEALQGIDPLRMGCQYDIRHASVEGAESWSLGLRQIASHVRCLAIKDYRWEKRGTRWVVENVPLGEGMVDFPGFFQFVKQLGLEVPVTLHVEYELLGPEQNGLDAAGRRKVIVAKIRRDLAWLNTALKTAGLA